MIRSDRICWISFSFSFSFSFSSEQTRPQFYWLRVAAYAEKQFYYYYYPSGSQTSGRSGPLQVPSCPVLSAIWRFGDLASECELKCKYCPKCAYKCALCNEQTRQPSFKHYHATNQTANLILFPASPLFSVKSKFRSF